MECRVGGSSVHYAEHGAGLPLVALHGAGVDHREIEAALESVLPPDGYRRIYPDLPGMGRTRVADSVASNEGVVALLGAFLDEVAPGPVLLLGHSYGGYLARGVAGRRPQVCGLALLCPVGQATGDIPPQVAVSSDPDAHDVLDPVDRAGFDAYFVVRTPATAQRYRDAVLPGIQLADEQVLGRLFAGWRIDTGDVAPAVPVLIAAGRGDSTAGFTGATDLLADYPQAALAMVRDAGHALPHERPDLLRALIGDWLDQVARTGVAS